jgi:hypothetical protein
MRKSVGKDVGDGSLDGIPRGNDWVYGTVVDSEIAARTTWAEKIARDEMATTSNQVLVRSNLEVLRGLSSLFDRRESIRVSSQKR